MLNLVPRARMGTKGKHGKQNEEDPVTEEEPAPEDETLTGKGMNGKPCGDQAKGHVHHHNPGCDPFLQFGKGTGRGGKGRYQVVRSSSDCIVFVALPRTPPQIEEMPLSTTDEPG